MSKRTLAALSATAALALNSACVSVDKHVAKNTENPATPEPPSEQVAVRQRPLVPGGKFVGFGEAGPGKVGINVSGDLVHEGDYYVSEDATLLSILTGVGEIAPYNPGTPFIITVKRRSGEEIRINTKKMITQGKTIFTAKDIAALKIPGIY